MAPIWTRRMPHQMTYWPPGTPDGVGGVRPGSPVAARCRWEDRAVLFRDAQGQEQTSRSVVYPSIDVELRGWLLRGSSSNSDPVAAGAREIRGFSESAAIRGDKRTIKVFL